MIDNRIAKYGLDVTIEHWAIFQVVIVILLAFDLYRFYKNPCSISKSTALWMSAGWLLVAMLVNLWIYVSFGMQYAVEFLTGYLVELSLSIDNLFVFLMLFTHFKIPQSAKHPVLFYGVLGAIVMRGLMIWAGLLLVAKFSWMILFFGIFLIAMGCRLAFHKSDESDIEHNFLYQLIQRYLPLTKSYHGMAFFIKQHHRWLATPLFVLLLMIEFTDLVFAIDSIPAIFGITNEPFIIYTSNICAILGLRALFFALEGVVQQFHLLQYALAFILVFIGIKMLLADFIHIPTTLSLSIFVIAIVSAMVASRLHRTTN